MIVPGLSRVMFAPLATLLFLSLNCLAVVSAKIGTLHRRQYFYVGQSYVGQGNSSIADGQMYVEHLIPAKVSQPFPLMMIHGHDMTGTNFLNTPDGRTGWADYFLSKGYEVYLVDQPARGRSPYQRDIDGITSTNTTFIVESRFTAPERFKLWRQASLHTQWPGNGSMGDAVFDHFFASTTPSLESDITTAEKVKAAGSKLLDQIGPVILLVHSQSGQHGWLLGDARPSLIKGLISIEPKGPPFIEAVFSNTPSRKFGLTDIPVTYSPPITSAADLGPVAVSNDSFTCFQQRSPPRKLINLAQVPVLMVTSEASYHAVYDDCSVQFLQQAGVSVEHARLPDLGIHGNGHMMFMEKNNLQIAEDVLEKWISKTIHH
ncbi:alpha beta-hydrolase [Collybia nuda]|uniref:Alpha beta-hydrolase n=1 Tax=Collybia nuda TaxID=64659 RepID=A0A9P6CQ90_9AGAR|nr:alpha beta-hydrolase [Collybia nuda]